MRATLSIFTLLLIVLLSSCGGGGTENATLIAKGGKKYGGELKFMSSEKVTTLFPAYSSLIYTARISGQMYNSLLSMNPETFKVTPSIAESYTVSEDGKTYTFKIRKGVMFHKDKCFKGKSHELDAHDVKFTLDVACSGLKDNSIAYLLTNKIEGAQAFFDTSTSSISKSGVTGIKVIDEHTIEIKLIHPFSSFVTILAQPSLGIVPREAFDMYGSKIGEHPVGTGPFALESFTDDKIVLKRNPNYWEKDDLGNQLPFLSKIIMTYSKDKRSELLAFRNSEVDFVLELPVEEIDHILGTLKEAIAGENVLHKVDSESSMSMFYIAMACESEEFSDIRVRKAFNLAVNRETIVDEWLEGEGWAATNGFVPKMGDYPVEKVHGNDYNVSKAKALLKAAGYPDGKGFPILDFYVNANKGSSSYKACQAIASQIKENLNISLNIRLCSYDEREQAVKDGVAKIWRSGWIADFPDPENFLGLFYGGNINSNSVMNPFHFKSDKFDALFEKALAENDEAKRIDLLVKCDQIVIDEAAVMPILTNDHTVMYNARIKNFNASPLELLNFTSVFIKENKKDLKKKEVK